MILRRYGSSYESVETNFDSKALTEIGFRRDRRAAIATDEFEGRYERVSAHELEARAEGHVHDETEQELLRRLQEQIDGLVAGLGEGEVLVIESEQGNDYPKTRTVQKNVVIEGENRLHFTVGVEPPLRVAVYREDAGS